MSKATGNRHRAPETRGCGDGETGGHGDTGTQRTQDPGRRTQDPEPTTALAQGERGDTGHSSPVTHHSSFAVALITLVGLGLRLAAIGHGLPYQYVPDESTMVGGALRMGATRSLEPNTFIYPAMLMYLFAGEYLGLLVVGRLAGAFSSIEQFREFAFTDPTLFYLLPRLAIALVGTATIPVAYLLTKRLYGRWAGVVAAALVATSVMHVQMSHQARHWVPVALLTLLVLWVSLDLAEKGRWRDYWLSGLLVGLTAATSFNGFLLLFFPLVAHIQYLRRRSTQKLSDNHEDTKTRRLCQGSTSCLRAFVVGLRMDSMLVALILPLMVFFALNPYIFLHFDRFIAFHSSGESSIGGQIRGHYTNYLQQFLEKQGFTFYAEATLAYEPAITLLSIIGAVLAIRRFRSTALLVLGYPVFHYLMFATTAPSMEQRYMLPAVVVLALPAGLAGERALTWIYQRLSGTWIHLPPSIGEGSGRGGSARVGPARAFLALAAGSFALLLAALVSLPSLRYDWLLSQTDTRTLAKQWIETNLPPGSDVAVESYPPPISPDLETLRAQQQLDPKSIGNRDQWLLEKGLPPGEVAYRLARLNLVDTSPAVDNLSPYLATHPHRYFVVSDFRWKANHQGHLALKGYLRVNGKLLAVFPAGHEIGYVPSDMLNNMEDPLVELWRIDRPGPTIQIYEVPR